MQVKEFMNPEDKLYLLSLEEFKEADFSKEDIDSIVKEVYNRDTLRKDVVLSFHSWAYYWHGYSQERPKYWVAPDGEYYTVNTKN